MGLRKLSKPLLNIELDHVVPDELHLLMRVMDVLLRNIIDDAKSKDEYAKITGQSTDNLSLLVKAIQGCGVTFKTWVSKSGELDWTSLCGSDVKKVLRLLPDKLVFCLHEDTRESVISLWKNFLAIYEEITLKSCMTFDETAIFLKVHCFMSLFLDIGKRKREGYLPKNVTPYLHTLLYHVPFFVSQYGSLAKFSGQGVEKTNDAIKHIHQTKSNRHDPTSDALRVRKRIELGHRSELTREKRKYEKQDNDYWGNRIIHIRESKKRRVEEEIYEANTLYQETHAKSHPNFEDMSDQEIKQKLIDLREKTKLRKREKLIEKLTAVMKAKELISLQ